MNERDVKEVVSVIVLGLEEIADYMSSDRTDWTEQERKEFPTVDKLDEESYKHLLRELKKKLGVKNIDSISFLLNEAKNSGPSSPTGQRQTT